MCENHIRILEYDVMETYKLQSKLFKALMHPVRLAILDCLREGEQCVCHLEAHLGYRQAYISQHLMVLRDAGLVSDRKDGWNSYYKVVQPEIYQVIDAAIQLTDPGAASLPLHVNSTGAACPCPKCS